MISDELVLISFGFVFTVLVIAMVVMFAIGKHYDG